MATKTRGAAPEPFIPSVEDRDKPPAPEGVQGIASAFDDLKLRGERWKAQLGDTFVDGTLARTVEGASTIAISVRDVERKLTESPMLQTVFDLELDDLGFTYVAARSQGLQQPLELSFESDVAARLRKFKGPKKAFRDKLTRAEFIHRLVLEAAKGWAPIPFFAYQLHKPQPVASGQQRRSDAPRDHEMGGSGLDRHAKLTVKGVKARSDQINLTESCLEEGAKLNAPWQAMVALVMCLINESQMQDLGHGSEDSEGPLQVRVGIHGSKTAHSIPLMVHKFMIGGYTGDGGGAIALAKAGAGPVEIAGRTLWGAGQTSYPGAPYLSEARRWVEAFNGGALAGSSGTTKTVTERYAYQIKKKEDYWSGAQRLAKEVGWRLFEVAGKLIYAPEPFLLASQPKMSIGADSPGVEDIAFDYDVGKAVTEVTVTARAKLWKAAPGRVVDLSDCGPANGKLLVAKIEAPLRRRDSLATISLKRATKPLPEPAPKTRSVSVGGGSGPGSAGSPSNAPKSVADSVSKMVAEIDALDGKFHYVWGGGHGDIKHRLTEYDCSGFVSHILYVGGLLSTPQVSGSLAGMYQPGKGKWLTIYANSEHVFGWIWTPDGGSYFECGGGADNATGWVKHTGEGLSRFSARHPKGF